MRAHEAFFERIERYRSVMSVGNTGACREITQKKWSKESLESLE